MFALISPQEPVSTGYRIVEVNSSEFEVAAPLFWVECNSTVNPNTYFYNQDDKSCELIPIPVPTAEENKITASNLLSATDWTSVADVGNPAMSNPYLANQAEFIEYRNAVRQYAVYPIAGNITFPTAPQEVWTKV